MSEENNEKPIFGRKIFFIAPPPNIFPFVTNKLRELEYEIYVIPDYKKAREILRKNPDSICFCNLDDQKLSVKSWLNYIKSYHDDDELKSTIMGVLSSRSRKNDRENFLMQPNLGAGYIVTSVGNTELVDSIKNILDVNGAKGRRQYVRANTANNPMAQIVCEKNNQMFTMQLQDISSVGFACRANNEDAPLFVKNSLLKDFTLRLEKKQITASAVIFATKPGDDFSILVMLFLPNQPAMNKPAIQEFIANTLEQTIIGDTQHIEDDQTDYEHYGEEENA